MNTQEIEINKNIIIAARPSAGAGGDVVRNINISFIPDVMIVKQISYYPDPADFNLADDYFLIYCDLIGDVIGNFGFNSDATAVALPLPPVCPNTSFLIKKPVTQSIKFSFQDITSVAIDNLQGVFVIQLDFIKYKSIQQQKLY